MRKRFHDKASQYLWQKKGQHCAVPITDLSHEELLSALMVTMDTLDQLAAGIAESNARIDKWSRGG